MKFLAVDRRPFWLDIYSSDCDPDAFCLFLAHDSLITFRSLDVSQWVVQTISYSSAAVYVSVLLRHVFPIRGKAAAAAAATVVHAAAHSQCRRLRLLKPPKNRCGSSTITCLRVCGSKV